MPDTLKLLLRLMGVVGVAIFAGLFALTFGAILYNDYVGFGYLAYVGVLFAFICDIVFNKALVTTEILNAILQAIRRAVQALRC
jgi:hypothetical protein